MRNINTWERENPDHATLDLQTYVGATRRDDTLQLQTSVKVPEAKVSLNIRKYITHMLLLMMIDQVARAIYVLFSDCSQLSEY